MECLIYTFPEVARLEAQPLVDLLSNAQLEHGTCYAGQPLRTALHGFQNLPLVGSNGSSLLFEQEVAVTCESRERGPEIMKGSGKEVRSRLIVFLQFEVCLHQALQDFVPLTSQGSLGGRFPFLFLQESRRSAEES